MQHGKNKQKKTLNILCSFIARAMTSEEKKVLVVCSDLFCCSKTADRLGCFTIKDSSFKVLVSYSVTYVSPQRAAGPSLSIATDINQLKH